MRILLAPLAVAALAAGTATAQTPAPAPTPMPGTNAHMAMARGHHGSPMMRADANHDGKLDRTEITASAAMMRGHKGGMGKARGAGAAAPADTAGEE